MVEVRYKRFKLVEKIKTGDCNMLDKRKMNHNNK